MKKLLDDYKSFLKDTGPIFAGCLMYAFPSCMFLIVIAIVMIKFAVWLWGVL